MGNEDKDPLAATTYPPLNQPISGLEATVGAVASAAVSGIEPTVAVGRKDDTELAGVERSHYTFDTEIARGGMGRIMRARDHRLGREVAVKEMLDATPDARLRFEREARITARLQHPGIVNIYEAGVFADGQAFYAMKLVTGESLDRVIRKTDPAARLALIPMVLAVADALAYSHSRRVIHRDLKPHNVLVGEFGETVVIDWGIAKDLSATDSTGASVPPTRAVDGDGETVAGAVMGTPAYMPREQAAGEAVDERADVYAIGAILYHVLSGKAPYTGATAKELLREVLLAAPRPLEDLVPDAPVDLLAIAAKAMARDPEDRYLSAREVAEDLRRFQTGQLVGAHRYSSWQLLRRFVARNRKVLAVAGILIAALAVTAVISVRRIIAERNEAEVQRGLADDAKRLAQDQKAAALAHRAGAEKLADFLLVKLKERLAPIGKLDLLQGIGDAVVAYYDTVAGAGSVGDDQLRQRADALIMLADVEDEKGDMAAALRSFETARKISTDLVTRHPDKPEYGFGLSTAEERLGRLALAQRDLSKADAHFTRAREIFAGLIAKDPDNAMYRRNGPVLDLLLSEVARERGELAQAVAAADRARAALERAASSDPKAATYLIGSYFTLATLHATGGDLVAAGKTLDAAVELSRTHSRHQPVDAFWVHMLAESTNRLGKLKTQAGHAGDALVALVESRDTAVTLTKLDEKNIDWLALLGSTHAALGVAYEALVRPDQAMASFREALAIRERIRAKDPADTTAVMNVANSRERIAQFMIARGDHAGAARELESVQQFSDDLAAKHPEALELVRGVGVVAEVRGDVAFARNDVDGALVLYRKGLKVAEQLSAKDPTNADWIRDVVGSHLKLAQAYTKKGDHEMLNTVTGDLVRHARRAVAIPGSDAEYLLVLALGNAANAQWGIKRADEATKLARESVEVGERDAKAHPQDASRMMALIEVEGILATTLSKSANGEARTVIARAQNRLTKLENEKRAPPTAAEMRKQLNGVEKLIAKGTTGSAAP